MSEINSKQLRGGGGGGGGSAGPSETVSFNYTTSSPFVLQIVAIGQLLFRSVVSITTVFDDPSATIQLGTSTTPNLIFGTSDIDLQAINQYENEILITISTNDLIILTISPGASTQGSGTIYYWLTS